MFLTRRMHVKEIIFICAVFIRISQINKTFEFLLSNRVAPTTFLFFVQSNRLSISVITIATITRYAYRMFLGKERLGLWRNLFRIWKRFSSPERQTILWCVSRTFVELLLGPFFLCYLKRSIHMWMTMECKKPSIRNEALQSGKKQKRRNKCVKCRFRHASISKAIWAPLPETLLVNTSIYIYLYFDGNSTKIFKFERIKVRKKDENCRRISHSFAEKQNIRLAAVLDVGRQQTHFHQMCCKNHELSFV